MNENRHPNDIPHCESHTFQFAHHTEFGIPLKLYEASSKSSRGEKTPNLLVVGDVWQKIKFSRFFLKINFSRFFFHLFFESIFHTSCTFFFAPYFPTNASTGTQNSRWWYKIHAHVHRFGFRWINFGVLKTMTTDNKVEYILFLLINTYLLYIWGVS